MQQALWKRMLSHFVELHIESAPTDINPHLYVSLNRGRYQLSTANAIYSFEDLYTNFSRAFAQLNLNTYAIQEVLILGFGLGSIPTILEQNFQKNYRYTALELDEAVVYLANKYTLPQLVSPIEILCADAYAYVLQSEQQFDMICMDVFLDASTPSHFKSVDYLTALKALLAPNGLLLYNCLAVNEEDIAAAKDFFENQFLSVFPHASYLDVGGNWMLVVQPIIGNKN